MKQQYKVIYSLVLFAISYLPSQAQSKTTPKNKTNEFVISAGYGFPSILRFLLNFEKKLDIAQFGAKGAGPFHGKAEYIYKNRIGLGASAFYNTIEFGFSNKLADTFKYVVKDFSLNGRLNLYIINTANQQLYIGAGAGRLFFNNKVIRITNPTDTFLKEVPTFTLSNKVALEATIGYRRKIYKQANIYGELGMGRIIKQFAKDGAIDSYLQLGACIRLGKRKEDTNNSQ